MNASRSLNPTQNRARTLIVRCALLVMLLSLCLPAVGVRADGPGDNLSHNAAGVADALALAALVEGGQADLALSTLAETAYALGGWAPAPGDVLAFDPALPDGVRGEVQMTDLPPFECVDARLSRGLTECGADYRSQQNAVRFGRGLFTDPFAATQGTPQASFDVLLVVYVEEVGHSWQEYLYETEGRGAGERLQPMSFEAMQRQLPGFEYQVKRYLLSLDGDLLHLPAAEHAELVWVLCHPDGYANPLGHEVSAYGPPPNWPHPEFWPTAAPTAAEHAAFCAKA